MRHSFATGKCPALLDGHDCRGNHNLCDTDNGPSGTGTFLVAEIRCRSLLFRYGFAPRCRIVPTSCCLARPTCPPMTRISPSSARRCATQAAGEPLRKRCPVRVATGRNWTGCSPMCMKRTWSRLPASTGWPARRANCSTSPSGCRTQMPGAQPGRALGGHHLAHRPSGADRVRRRGHWAW